MRCINETPVVNPVKTFRIRTQIFRNDVHEGGVEFNN